MRAVGLDFVRFAVDPGPFLRWQESRRDWLERMLISQIRLILSCDLAVIELGRPDVPQRIAQLVARGVPVLAFGSHVDAGALRAARELGARAVPNSEVEHSLRALL